MQQTLEVTNADDYKSQVQKHIPKYEDRLSDELVIALVGPIASGITATAQLIGDLLSSEFGYEVFKYKLSDVIKQDSSKVSISIQENSDFASRIESYQSAGDKLRETYGSGYLASRIVSAIAKNRNDNDGFMEPGDGSEKLIPKQKRWVHIIDSIKHPAELNILKRTYGDILWLYGVFAPLQIRKERLKDLQVTEVSATHIIDRDYSETAKYGQKVKDVFHQSDFFIRNDTQNKSKLEDDVKRFLDVMFGSPQRTPTKDESSMYSAYAEACRSACLSRQVGAAVVDATGNLIGLGRNDVPKANGGLYESEESQHTDRDARCFAWKNGQCHNDARKDKLYRDIFRELSEKKILKDQVTLEEVMEAVKSTDVKSLIEYSRAVHAEMDAIISIARTNKPGLIGATLYCTTYPCHSCARHIVASGIKKVLFIEPYPKSLAQDLHSDSIDLTEGTEKVKFLQYMGVAPKNMLKLFKIDNGRKQDGKIEPFERRNSKPVVRVSLDDYTMHERLEVARLQQENIR